MRAHMEYSPLKTGEKKDTNVWTQQNALRILEKKIRVTFDFAYNEYQLYVELVLYALCAIVFITFHCIANNAQFKGIQRWELSFLHFSGVL